MKTKYFISDLFEIELSPVGNRALHYIMGGDGLAAVVDYNGTLFDEPYHKEAYYILKDYLGSWYAVTDETGHVATYNGELQIYNFDPWGRRRNAISWTYENVPTGFLFDRGFTGYEYLDASGLINMNGRVYDPVLARFLSPDPIVQNVATSQNFNRYSYSYNNPLGYVDPSGFFVIPALTTSDPNQIESLMNFLSKGGDFESYTFTGWLNTEFSQDNPFGIFIEGSTGFREKIIQALYKINATRLGYIVIHSIMQNAILAPLFIQSSWFNYKYDELTETIQIGSFVLDREPQNYFETNLGHELWHAFQRRNLGGEYMNMITSVPGKKSLEAGAVAFENYLAFVLFDSDKVRTGYFGYGELWFGLRAQKEYFNPLKERLFPAYPKDCGGNPVTVYGPLGWNNTVPNTPDIIKYYQQLASIWLKP